MTEGVAVAAAASTWGKSGRDWGFFCRLLYSGVGPGGKVGWIRDFFMSIYAGWIRIREICL